LAAGGKAQQRERMRRIGILLPAAADDAEYHARVGAFHQGLALSGWIIGGNLRIDTRGATANAADIRRNAAELVALAPDVILASAASTVGPLLQATSTVPIVFAAVGDPVGAGLVDLPGPASRLGGGKCRLNRTSLSSSGVSSIERCEGLPVSGCRNRLPPRDWRRGRAMSEVRARRRVQHQPHIRQRTFRARR
jgi:hypothetical protein